MTIRTNSPGQTRGVGKTVGRRLRAGDLVLLTGELGAGKTTFIQGVCRGLGVASSVPVRSPSYTIIHEYKGDVHIRHADLYRVESDEDFDTVGLFDEAFDGVMLVEWADRMPGAPMAGALNVRLVDVSQTEREISFRWTDDRLKGLL